MVRQQVLPQMRLLCFTYEGGMPDIFRLLHFHWNSGEVDDASLHLEQKYGETDSGQFLSKRHHFVAI